MIFVVVTFLTDIMLKGHLCEGGSLPAAALSPCHPITLT